MLLFARVQSDSHRLEGYKTKALALNETREKHRIRS